MTERKFVMTFLIHFGGGEKMKNKILVSILTLLIFVMMITPVLAAIGPTKANADKNKNIIVQYASTVWLKVKFGQVFQEWVTNEAEGWSYRLMRLDASKAKIGNAEDGSLWTITPDTPGPTFMMLVRAETNWVYFDYDAMYDLLRGFGMSDAMANGVRAPFDPAGCYYRAYFVQTS
jgi:hypothetical protein